MHGDEGEGEESRNELHDEFFHTSESCGSGFVL
jgi:hypothetical protein